MSAHKPESRDQWNEHQLRRAIARLEDADATIRVKHKLWCEATAERDRYREALEEIKRQADAHIAGGERLSVLALANDVRWALVSSLASGVSGLVEQAPVSSTAPSASPPLTEPGRRSDG